MTAAASHDVAMRLCLKAHRIDGVDVLEVGGELDLWTAPALCARIEDSAHEPAARILVDLSQVQFCDSTGLRAVAGAVREARLRPARVVVVRPLREGAAHAF